jgi:hypothetical protein
MGRTAGRRGGGRGAVRPPASRPARRAGQAQARRPKRTASAHLGWARRIGVAFALLVGGVSVVFAGQALVPAGPGQAGAGSPAATTSTPARLPLAPQLAQPAVTLTSEPAISLSGRLLEELPRDAGYRLRVYLNGTLVRDRRLPRRDEFTLDELTLTEGANSITAAVAGPAGEGLHSGPVQIVLDSTPPSISLLEPAAGETVYLPSIVLRGTSEAGASLRLTNQATGRILGGEVGVHGTFALTIELLTGFNELRLETRDRAGNQAQASLTIERRLGEPSVRLSMSRTALVAAALPTAVSLSVEVRDESGAPIDGAEVVFSLSPPGLPTITYSVITVAGLARWDAVRISTDAQTGQGLATVLVTLEGGETLTDSVLFTIE